MKIKTKTQYKFGNCIPISDIVYNRLKKKGYKPKIVIGWVEINEEIIEGEILPDKKFLKLFKNNRALTFPHTWIECNNHIIDITQNQFDIYKGINEYYPAYIDIPNKKFTEHNIIKYENNIL